MCSQYDPNRFDLIDGRFCNLDLRVKQNGIASLSENEAVVYFTWGALGLLENGSFEYFFENNWDASKTSLAFRALDLPAIAELFDLAASLLPDEYAATAWEEKLQMLQKREPEFDSLARRVLEQTEEIEAKLEAFILK